MNASMAFFLRRASNLVLLGASISMAQGAALPTAPVRNVTDTYFGTVIDDPYRYFENKADPEVMAWLKAQDAHARAQLARIPGRDAMLQTMVRYDASVSDRVAQVTRLPGDVYFMERRAAAENQFKLYKRQGLTGSDKLLVDPEAMEKKTGKPHAIHWFSPSPDGRLVAYGLSTQGSEAAVLHLLDTQTGKEVGKPIDRADFGGVDWAPDGKTLVFNRLQPLKKGSPEIQKYQHSQALALKVGAGAGTARAVFGTAIKGLDVRPAEIPVVGLTHDGRWAIGTAYNGTQRELGVFLARQVFAVAADGQVSNTGLQPTGPFDAPADIVTTEVKVKSHDGAMVPLSIIHHRNVQLDGNNPTLLYGYASYGVTEEPFYSVSRLAWLNAGGVYAVANPRGSSVYGQDWYKAGFQTTKPNTWKDFIACAEFLIAQKYTQPSRLGILGGSAGGILVGRAMTERPDLFAAVIPAVGALDGLRFETTPNGVPNIPEFGSVKTESGFKALLAMSTYANTRAGTAYPAVLLTHGVNDPRVEVWQSTKAAARLMAATTSGKPVLLRLDFDAGHGIGNTKKQQLEERADMFAFLLWQMGVAGYQP